MAVKAVKTKKSKAGTTLENTDVNPAATAKVAPAQNPPASPAVEEEKKDHQGVAKPKASRSRARNTVKKEAETAKPAEEEKKDESKPDDRRASKGEDGGPGNDETKTGGEGNPAAEAEAIQPPVDEAKNEEKMKNGCQTFCAKVMQIFANDAIYGSFVGPHPVSFLCFCKLFKKKCPCTKKCGRPFCVASIATKLMTFIMLGIITILAGFFVIPWPNTFLSVTSTSLSSFYPCQGNKMIKYQEANGGCAAHAGYFMAYRCFFAFAIVMLTSCFVMIRVTSTRDDPYRSRIHYGFWLYKYMYLFTLLIILFFMVDGDRDPEGIFEFTVTIFGNIAHMFFSFVEISLVMDLVELWVYENRTGNNKWAGFIYWMATILVFLVDIIIYCKIWVDFSQVRKFRHPNDTLGNFPPWPKDNCIEGEKRDTDWKHTSLIVSSLAVVMALLIATSFRKMCNVHDKFPYIGWLQTSVMIFFNFVYLWSALYSSSNVHSRPRCNAGINLISSPRVQDPKEGVQSGSWDVYLRLSGVFHGVLCVLTMLYIAFVHGPRSHTAPLSLFYSVIFQVTDRIPVFPDDNDEESEVPSGYLRALATRKVWDDEQVAVAHSWSIFYLMMMLGSLSLMMSMTNFTNPWAADHYNSSNIAFWCKFLAIVFITVIYISLLILPCKDVHAYGMKSRRIRKRSVLEVIDFTTIHVEKAEGDELDAEASTKHRGFRFHISQGGKKSTDANFDAAAGAENKGDSAV